MANNKYNQLKRQYSLDGGVTWYDVSPMVYKVGNLIEANSNCTDESGCRWVELPLSEAYDCDSNYNLYSVEAEECLQPNGLYKRTGATRRFMLVDTYSTLCGYTGSTCTPSISVTKSYEVIYNGGAVEYNEYATPVVYEIVNTTNIDKGCNETTSTSRNEITDYTISYNPSDYNYTDADRTVTATVTYNGSEIGNFQYTQKYFYSKPVDTEDTVMYSSNVTPRTYNDCGGENRLEIINEGNGMYNMIYKNRYFITRRFIIDLETGEKKIKFNHLINLADSTYAVSNGPNYIFSDKLILEILVDYSTPKDELYVFNENSLDFSKIYDSSYEVNIGGGSINGGLCVDKYTYLWDSANDKPLKRLDKNLILSDVGYTEINGYYIPTDEILTYKGRTVWKSFEVDLIGLKIYNEPTVSYSGNMNGNHCTVLVNDEEVWSNYDTHAWYDYHLYNGKYFFLFDYKYNKLYICYDGKCVIKENAIPIISSDTGNEMWFSDMAFFKEENELWIEVMLYRSYNTWLKYNFTTMEYELSDELYDYETNNYIYHRYISSIEVFNFYSPKYDYYFDFDNIYYKDGTIKTNVVNLRSKYNCDYYLMTSFGAAVFIKEVKEYSEDGIYITDNYECIVGYTNANDVVAYYEEEREKISEMLEFTYSGSSLTYKLNGSSYTANTGNSVDNGDGTYTYSTTLTDLGISELTSCYQTFQNASNLLSIEKFPDTLNVTNMSYMFNNCQSLTNLDLSLFDTSNVTDMYGMFQNCSALTSIDLSVCNLSNATNMNNMFNTCNNLQTVTLGTNSLKCSFASMFAYCGSLTSIDLNNFDLSNATSCYMMFYYCSGLTSIGTTTITLSHNNVSNGNPISCENMFAYCSGLTGTIEVIGVTDETKINANSMFRYCRNLNNVKYSKFWFYVAPDTILNGTSNLSSLDVSGCIWQTTASNPFSLSSISTIYAYNCDSSTISRLNSLKPTNCTLVY